MKAKKIFLKKDDFSAGNSSRKVEKE